MLANIFEVKNKLSAYIHKAIKGEDVIITRYNIPLVKLVPVKNAVLKNKTLLGRSKTKGKILDNLQGPFMDESHWEMHGESL